MKTIIEEFKKIKWPPFRKWLKETIILSVVIVVSSLALFFWQMGIDVAIEKVIDLFN